MSTPFRERNPVMVGALSLAVLAAAILAAFRYDDLPLIGDGDTYYAAFTEAGGLKPNDEVRIAGVRIGKVDEISLDGDHVKVALTVERSVELGTETRAEIRIRTLLGAMYLSLEPMGSGALEEGDEIPVARTSSPYQVVEAVTGLADTSARINTDQLKESLETLTELTSKTPQEFRAALKGISALASNISTRDQQLNTLLTNLHNVTGVLAHRRQDIIGLMRDADALFRALAARRAAVHNLFVATSHLSRELTGLVRNTRADLTPALTHLETVVNVLLKNQDNLDESLRLLAPFYRVIANTLGNGPWLDIWIANLPPTPQVPGSSRNN